MGKTKNDKGSPFALFMEWHLHDRMAAILLSIAFLALLGLTILVVLLDSSRPTPLEKTQDAYQAYDDCIETDNSHEFCLLEAIEAYN